ncbi:MAG: MarR family transcriptional regulator [Thermofilaceae archaeon]
MPSALWYRPGFSDAAALLSMMLVTLGIPRSCARVLAVLYLSEKPLTSRELAELTGYSRSTISAATRMLASRRMIRKLRRGRHDTYVAHIGLSQLLLEAQISLLEHVVKKIGEIRLKINSTLGNKLAAVERELTDLISIFKGE